MCISACRTDHRSSQILEVHVADVNTSPASGSNLSVTAEPDCPQPRIRISQNATERVSAPLGLYIDVNIVRVDHHGAGSEVSNALSSSTFR